MGSIRAERKRGQRRKDRGEGEETGEWSAERREEEWSGVEQSGVERRSEMRVER